MSRSTTRYLFPILIVISFLLGNCSQGVPAAIPSATKAASQTTEPGPPAAEVATGSPAPTPPTEVINPLTGLPVKDPSLLQIPATLLSISHFPVTARPQAGLSFAPYVFEIYITEGATRFLTAFYGQLPAPEIPITGNCEVRREIFTQTGLLLGNQVWNDENQNGIQEAWENGIGGVCVNLYDADRQLLQQTTTDTNGYYGFNVDAGTYYVAFAKPDGMEFTPRDVSEDEQDSDVDPATGWTDQVNVTSSLLTWTPA